MYLALPSFKLLLSQRFGTATFLARARYSISASKVTVHHVDECASPQALVCRSFTLTNARSTTQQHKHISVYFWKESKPLGVVWTFKYDAPHDGKFLKAWLGYVQEMESTESEECKVALQQYINRCLVSTDWEARSRLIRAQKQVYGKLEPLNDQIKHLVNRIRSWKEEDVGALIKLRMQGKPLRYMTKILGKPATSVKRVLGILGSAPFELPTVYGPQELPPSLRTSLFNSRLLAIWQGLLRSEMTSTWRDAILKKTTDEWLSSVSECIPAEVKYILGGLRPVRFQDLCSLQQISTHHAGVYARLMESRFECKLALDRHVYVGSASGHGGLEKRMEDHKMGKKRRPSSNLEKKIKVRDLPSPGIFVILMVKEMDSSRVDEVLDVRRTVVIAEAILTMWIGALQSPAWDLKNLSPWKSDTLDYSPLCSHNPLLMDIIEPRESRGD